jgi:magnesium chelatase subunit D
MTTAAAAGQLLPPRVGPLPLPALVAVDTPRLALLMLAVEPRLRGLVLVGPVGSGKSALLGGVRSLLPGLAYAVLPAGADEEALLGGLDLEASLREGRSVVRPGLLERCDGGWLAVPALNLLNDSGVHALLAALEEGELHVEREGLSRRATARFRLLASYDPADGEARAHLLDRVGLIVPMPALGSAAARAEILRRHCATADGAWAEEEGLLRSLVETAGELLPTVRCPESLQRELVEVAVALGVQGHRGDSFAVCAARASAALSLRDEVEREDLELAVKLVLMPRATRRPEPAAPEQDQPAAPDGATAAPDATDAGSDTAADSVASGEGRLADEVLEAVEVDLGGVLDSLPFATQRRASAGSRGTTAGRRGRHVSSGPGDVRRQRVDLLATLRAAARWQRLRPRGERLVSIRADDLRVKRYSSKAGALFLFAVDASGSMALHRMRQAKGAVHALLEQAYVNRDRVALLSFRGEGAQLLLPPTGSVELVRRAVDQLPTGGGTPLAATLLSCLDIAERARRRGFGNVVLVLLTDGRANVGVRCDRAGVDEELRQVAASVARSPVRSLVIDTQRGYLSRGNASRLAEWLGGRYLYLPSASGEAIATAVRSAGLEGA